MDVMCIDDNFSPEQAAAIPNRPFKGKLYTVRDVVKSSVGVGLLLNEIHNPHNGWTVMNGMKFTFEPNFHIRRFAKLDEQPLAYEDIKEFVKQPDKVG